MPRDAEKVRQRLQEAALALFETQGYDAITAADIAAAAGVTQRTFFRHFPDKREVLFSGDAVFIATLARAVADAPADLGAWETMRQVLHAVEPLFIANRGFSLPRQRIIAGHPALQERAQTKVRDVMAALTAALRARGVPDHLAGLAAHIGMAAMHQAVTAWFASDASDLGVEIDRAFQDVRALAAANLEAPVRE